MAVDQHSASTACDATARARAWAVRRSAAQQSRRRALAGRRLREACAKERAHGLALPAHGNDPVLARGPRRDAGTQRTRLGRGTAGDPERWAHNEQFTTEQTLRALDTTQLLLDAVNASDECEPGRQDASRAPAHPLCRRSAGRAEAGGNERNRGPADGGPEAVARGRHSAPGRRLGPLPAGRVRCRPAPGLARRSGVGVRQAGRVLPPHVPHGRSRALLLNATRRLRGEGGDPVVELQTNFGGGKTHSLIALYHLAGGYPPAELAGVESMLAEEGLGAHLARTSPCSSDRRSVPGMISPERRGVEVRTLWGELAWQLGGRRPTSWSRTPIEPPPTLGSC